MFIPGIPVTATYSVSGYAHPMDALVPAATDFRLWNAPHGD
jgi:hypothetical protein